MLLSMVGKRKVYTLFSVSYGPATTQSQSEMMIMICGHVVPVSQIVLVSSRLRPDVYFRHRAQENTISVTPPSPPTNIITTT